MTNPEFNRYQLQVFLSKIGSKTTPPPVFLPSIPAVNGEEFLRWLAETVPLHRASSVALYTRDDRTSRCRGGSVGWQVIGKLVLPG